MIPLLVLVVSQIQLVLGGVSEWFEQYLSRHEGAEATGEEEQEPDLHKVRKENIAFNSFFLLSVSYLSFSSKSKICCGECLTCQPLCTVHATAIISRLQLRIAHRGFA